MTFDFEALPAQRGRLAVITGANTGLGFETARYFALKGMQVVMACRNEDKAKAAMARITEEVPGAELEFIQLDLSSLDSVRRFAESFREKFDRLDLLINNAGIMWTPYEKTEDGFEAQMAANYFGHFLLTALLLDLMPDRPESRVVTLSSIAHQQFLKRIRFEDINWEEGYNKYHAYAQTKLACLMFALELQRRLAAAGRKVLSVAAHPGVSETELGRYMDKWLVLAIRYTVGPFISHEPSRGALPTVVAALGPGVSGGDYFGPRGFREMSGGPGLAEIKPWAADAEAAAQLWAVSGELTGAVYSL
jgi:NAD(P)-dependent dehydrogenase (short-subunit alcohol dehydrogenase family)